MSNFSRSGIAQQGENWGRRQQRWKIGKISATKSARIYISNFLRSGIANQRNKWVDINNV